MIGKWSVGEIGKEMTVGDIVELADIPAFENENADEWEMRHVKSVWSRSDNNWMALESVRSSTWMLKLPVIRNSWGEVDTDEMSVWKSSRNWKTYNADIS